MASKEEISIEEQSRVVSVVVPEDAKPGDTHTFKLDDGLEIEMTIPEDSKPGDRIEIPLPDDVDDFRELFMQLHPSNGNMLYFSSLGEEEEGESEGKENDDDDDDDEDEDADGTNTVAWPAGIQLAQFITSPEAAPFLQDKMSVLDLGSGMGVSGLAIASAVAELDDDNKREVVLTDLPNAIALVQSNVEFNRDTIQKGEDDKDAKVTLRSVPLTWGQTNEDAEDELKGKNFDLVVGSDILYDPSPDVLKALAKTMDSFVSDGGKIFLSTRWRKPNEERVFFEEMERIGYDFKLVHEALNLEARPAAVEEKKDEDENAPIVVNPCFLSWKERGNTESEGYKKFFADTKVNVSGESIPLCEVTEEQLESMEDEEFDTAEDLNIQLYVGHKE
uniref:Calmodulin-lysine N-methyltransferase n=1 Tax=Odontella aurita TaxID=265563 RepID=A0A7S4K5H5_9STRA